MRRRYKEIPVSVQSSSWDLQILYQYLLSRMQQALFDHNIYQVVRGKDSGKGSGMDVGGLEKVSVKCYI